MHERTARRKAAADERAQEETDALALELLEPYRSLARLGHPLAPVVSAALERPPVEAVRLLREVLAAWPLSLFATLQDLYRHVDGRYELSGRGLLVLFDHLEAGVRWRLHPGRRRQLERFGADPGGASSSALFEAAVRVRGRSGVFTEDLPDSIDRTPKALRNALTEAVSEGACPGWRRGLAEVEARKAAEPGRRRHRGAKSPPAYTESAAERILVALHEEALIRRAGLTDAELRAWRLMRDEELSAREAGERLGCSAATVWVHLHNARKKLAAVA